MTLPATATSLRFGRFELQPLEQRLLADGQPVALGARAFDLLHALAQQPGRLVDKRTLIDLVWPGRVVQENNLAAQMSALRKVVGDEVVATIPGRGYRFVARLDTALQSPDAAAPAAAQTPSLRTNLPTVLPSLVGRDVELAQLGALVDAHRLVSVVGAGGIGKSLLSQHLLDARRSAYAQGVCWVELPLTGDAASIPATIATALGLHGAAGASPATLAAALAPLSILLALDNAEHVLAGVAELVRLLLAAAPQLHVVVTSQAPLRLADERVLRLGPLALPPDAMKAAQALQFGAVALFVERAQAIDARWRFADAEAAAVIGLCRALDGMPLPIELAAARAPLLGVPALLASMPDRLRLLTANRNRHAPPRQRTLRATLAWSHDLLRPDEQRVWRRLAVVQGSASLALVQALAVDADGGDPDRWAVLDALDALVDRSLVVVLADAAMPRYRLLESPRALALERLEASGEAPATRRRHALGTAALFDAAYDRYFDGRCGADAWRSEIGLDAGNGRAAFACALEAGDAGTALTLGATMLRAWPPSRYAERMALADTCERLLDGPLPERLQQRVWLELSSAWADTHKQRSRTAAERALTLARGLDASQGDRFMRYYALCRVASAAAQMGDLAAADAPLAELRRIEDPAWPPQRLIWGTEAEQVITRQRGDREGALRLSHRLLALDRARGCDASIAFGNLIDAELAAGDAEGAARSGLEFVAALEGTRHEYTLAYARLNLAAAWLAHGDAARARAVAERAWPQAMAYELQHYAADYLALLAALESRPHAAARLLGYARRRYAAHDEQREANEAQAVQRASELARAALGDAAFAAAQAEGEGLRDAEIAAIAFARDDR